MTGPRLAALLAAASVLSASAAVGEPTTSDHSSLTGAWRSRVQFANGAFAAVRDLEFMYVVHGDGTLTESSNYDAAPPVPPAYGVWRRIGPHRFQAHYEFYTTAAPAAGASLASGWTPSGRGLLDETITLSADGRSFSSTLHLQLLNVAGAPTGEVGDAQGQGVRIDFAAAPGSR